MKTTMKQSNSLIQFSPKAFILMLALVLLAQLTFAQQKQMPNIPIYYSNSGNVNNPMLVTEKPQGIEKSQQEKDLEKQLDIARLAGNTMAARKLQADLDRLRGHVQVYETPLHVSVVDEKENNNYQAFYGQSTIHSYSTYSHAFAVAPTGSPLAGRLYYIFSQDSQNGADTLKIMHSTDNGATWGVRMYFDMGNYIFNQDEMDIEIVFDGTNTWMFGVIGIYDPSVSRKKIHFFRLNIGNSAYYSVNLTFPGSGAGMNYYNPRITSDNSNFTSNAYVMMICSMDSLAGSDHIVKQKYMLMSTPFDAVPSYNYAQPSGSSGFSWYANNGTAANTYLYSDIAYYKDDGGTGDNRVMTVYGNYGSAFNSIYVAYLNGYSGAASQLVISEPNINKDVKIAFNGGSNNRNGMITYVRQFDPVDWDVFGFRTTNGGSLAANWTRDTIDYTSDRSRSCDLVAVRNAVNQFKICYSQNNPSAPASFYKTFNGSAWSNSFKYSSSTVDTQYAKPKAGYVLGGGDDGVGFWSTYNGYNGYCSKQIMSTTGISNNNEIPSGFSLSQNYPNPFNPVTNIKFSIPKAGLVTLKIYDITGKEVAQIVNQNLNTGSYTYDFDASNLASGAYFYKMSADGFTDVKKMVLVK